MYTCVCSCANTEAPEVVGVLQGLSETLYTVLHSNHIVTARICFNLYPVGIKYFGVSQKYILVCAFSTAQHCDNRMVRRLPVREQASTEKS